MDSDKARVAGAIVTLPLETDDNPFAEQK